MPFPQGPRNDKYSVSSAEAHSASPGSPLTSREASIRPTLKARETEAQRSAWEQPGLPASWSSHLTLCVHFLPLCFLYGGDSGGPASSEAEKGKRQVNRGREIRDSYLGEKFIESWSRAQKY
jgi:hypothetical protein